MPKKAKNPEGPETVGRCPVCRAPFVSRYALKVHRRNVLACQEPTGETALGAALQRAGAAP